MLNADVSILLGTTTSYAKIDGTELNRKLGGLPSERGGGGGMGREE